MAAERLENIVAEVARTVLGTTEIERDGRKIDLAPPWRRITLRDAIREEAGIDIAEHPTARALAEAMRDQAGPRGRAGASWSTG